MLTPNIKVAMLILTNAPINSAKHHLAKRLHSVKNPTAKKIHLSQVAGAMPPKPASMELIPNALLPYVKRTQSSSIALWNIARKILQTMDARYLQHLHNTLQSLYQVGTPTLFSLWIQPKNKV